MIEKEKILRDIRKAMTIRQLTQSDLASRMGMSQARVSQILKGQFSTGSRAVSLLHTHAREVLEDPDTKAAAAYEGIIQEAALEAWDHTEAGAKALLELLRRVKFLRDQGR